MKSAYIFHDAFSSPTEDWYPWMKATLEAQGYFVVVPTFPTPAGQSYESWKTAIRNYQDKFDGETIIIGHGTGGLFALRILAELPAPISKLVLVASYAEPIGHVGYDKINETFFKTDLNWETIKKNAGTVHVYAGGNDPFVPETISAHLAESLGVAMQVIPEGGHINKASGFSQLVAVASELATAQVPPRQTPPPLVPRGTSSFQEEESAPHTLDFEARVAPLGKRSWLATASSQTEEFEGAPQSPRGSTHTMYADMSRLINSNQGAVASSLLTKARDDEAMHEAASPASKKNIFYLLGILIILGMIVGIAGYLLQKYAPAFQTAVVPTTASLLPAEKHTVINPTPTESYQLESSIRTALQTLPERDTLHDIAYTNTGTFGAFPNVLATLGITTLPVVLDAEFQNILPKTNPQFMHASVNTGTKVSHFLILPFKEYDTVFRGMRDWEVTMFRDVGIFTNVSSAFLKSYVATTPFQDELIANHPTRTLHYQTPINPTLAPYSSGDIMLSYFFLSERALVITDDPALIPAILKRYANRQIYQ